jgi:hypothetical protein
VKRSLKGFLDFPLTCTPRPNADILQAPSLNSNAAKLFYEKDMESDLAEMNPVLNLNASATARK